MSSSVLMTCGLKVNLLGPVELVSEKGEADLRPQLRVLLSALAMSANHVVSVSSLIDTIWQEEPSLRRHRNLHAQIYQLRRRLGAAELKGESRLVRSAHGYRLALRSDDLDATVFTALSSEGRRLEAEGSHARAARLFEDSLAQWRGPALADVAELSPKLAAEAARLDELRTSVAEEWVQCRLATGEHSEVLSELAALTSRYPLRERLAGQLMLALYRSARRSEALAVFDRTRRLLSSELGLDPGPMLAALHLQILRDDPDLLVPGRTGLSLAPPASPRPSNRIEASAAVRNGSQRSDSATRPTRAPRQLPATAAHFAGRSAELAELDGLLGQLSCAEADLRPGTAITVSIVGMAGVGKTTLAVAWAKKMAARFPDGQLYVDLRGDNGHRPPAVMPQQAIGWMLAALVAQPQQIPADEYAQAGLYRTMLASRRMLIVLDNARDAAQVRPLLAGGPGTMVIVTSRAPLTELAAVEGNKSIRLDPLDQSEASQLLMVRLGQERVNDEPAAAAEIVRVCDGLPLALAIVAARAAASPQLRLQALAAQLASIGEQPGAPSGVDPATTTAPEVFAWSAGQLSTTASRTLALLATHCGPDITVPAAASLTALTPAVSAMTIEELANASLVYQHEPGRFLLHDLIRGYADRTQDALDVTAVRAAVTRAVKHYLQAAAAPCTGAVGDVEVADVGHSIAWLRAEQWVLLRAIGWAASHDLSGPCWQIFVLLAVVLAQQGRWADWAEAGQVALAAAARAADNQGIGRVHRSLALRAELLGSGGEAVFHYDKALEHAEKAGDLAGQAHTHLSIAQSIRLAGQGLQDDARWRAGASDGGLMHAQRSAELFRRLADKHHEGLALACLGDYYSLLGRHELAAEYCSSAIELQTEAGSVTGQRHAWHALGWAHRRRGNFDVAVRCLEQALSLSPDVTAHEDWGHALVITGDLHGAPAAWQQAVEVLDKLRHPDSEAVCEPTPYSVLARTTGPGRAAHDCSSRQPQEVD